MFLIERLVLLIGHVTVYVLFWITWPILRLTYGRSRGQLPVIGESLLLVSATQLAEMVRTKQVSAEAVMLAYIARQKSINPALNAVVAERYSAAITEAQALDKMLAETIKTEEFAAEKKPFLGVPFTAKEAFAVLGMTNSSGLLSRQHLLASYDADSVAALKAAGAIPFALTNCSELCMWYESSNLVYGRTNNPYHQGRMVGGSSGGEGCVLAAAGSVIGIGSDVGGSIRMPAFFNGVFGHKPTAGCVSNDGQFPYAGGMSEDYLCTGPMCRYAEDLLPALKAMCLPKAAVKLRLDTPVSLRRVRVFYMAGGGAGWLVHSVTSELQTAIRRAAAQLGAVCASVESVDVPGFAESLPMWSAHMARSGAPEFEFLMADGSVMSLLQEMWLWFTLRPRHTFPALALACTEKLPFSDAQVEDLSRQLTALKLELNTLLGEDGVLLYPSHPRPAYYHHHPIAAPFNFAYTGIFNVLGLPVTQVPLGLGAEGVPLGVQVVAGHYQDRVALAVARRLEQAMGGWVDPAHV